MQFVSFVLIYPIIWLLSRLPLRILYVFSTFFYWLVYYVVGYRKKVVFKNLKLAFPEKPDYELKLIQKKFYKHFIDILVESIKSFSISEKEITKRYQYKNPELINKYLEEGRSVCLLGGHLANWEWSINMPLFFTTPNIDSFVAYTRLQNKYFDAKIRASRQRFGVEVCKSSKMISRIQEHISNNKQGVYGFLSDQSPQRHRAYHWYDFFNIKVPVHTGAEMLSKRFDMVLINYVARKTKRGYYEVEYQLIAEHPKNFEDYKLTERFTELMEENIRKQPEYYFWTHKRFKHRNKVPKQFQ
ncbi:lipid A biosynthesis acyltransferase [Polaribacter sp.]|nr:lipid A biosynthesis acyltransferase [Polaribacter sp.]